MGRDADPLAGREIILEWNEYGDVVRVNAIDAGSGVEASASGPRSAARYDLKKLALKGLARKLFGGASPFPDGPPDNKASGGAPGRGRIV